MDATPVPLAPTLWDVLSAEAQTLILGLQAEVSALQERIRELEAHIGQDSSNSSRPPSSDPPHAVRKRPASPIGRKCGGQPGHRGQFRYQTEVRRCRQCGKRTRATLPVGVPLRPFGPRLTAVVALLTGRYRLSRREVQRVLVELWNIKLSLGAVLCQERAQSAASAPVVTEVRAAVRQAAVVNVDETGWREGKRRAWLWTAVTPSLTAFLIDRSRGATALVALVGSDRWSVYSRFPAERPALCYAHLKRDFQALVDRGGEAESIGRWGLAELERLFGLWHRFRAGEFDRKVLQRRLVPLRARLGRLV